MRGLAAGVVICLSIGCRQPEATPLIVESRCLTDGECGPMGRCDVTRQQCYREAPDHDYKVYLQVHAQAENLTLVEQHNASFMLSKDTKSLEIIVPESELVSSGVTTLPDTAVEAEVTFTPAPDDADAMPSALPTKPTVVNARARDGERNVNAWLNPGITYAVSVQPLVEASKELPPMQTTVMAPSRDLSLAYDAMTVFEAKLLDESGKAMAGCRVRLEAVDDGDVLSSTMEVKKDGSFKLYADPAVLAERPFHLAISLHINQSDEVQVDFPPWQVKVTVDGAQLTGSPGSTVWMPTVPRTTRFSGKAVAESGTAPYADVAFVSQFTFDKSQINDVGKVDWCKWVDAKNQTLALSCSASLYTTADSEGRYSLDTLPGLYEIFATPSDTSPELATSQLFSQGGNPLVAIEAQPDNEQGGQSLTLGPAAHYNGQVKSYDGRALPNVTLTAQALAYKGELTEEVARYNRTTSDISDGHGKFDLALDIGYFDLLVEPPADSGFAWSGSLNRILDDSKGAKGLAITMQPPVYVTGQVQAKRTGSEPLLLPAARIEAYAIVSSPAGGQRAVRIGQTTSDALGAFRLGLPASIGEELCDPKELAYCECSVGDVVVRKCTGEGTYATCECPLPPDSVPVQTPAPQPATGS